MLIDIITAFPGLVQSPLQESIIHQARRKGLVDIRINDLREWTTDRHRTIDDTPYGGGAGMIFKVEPLYDCLNHITGQSPGGDVQIFLTSPRGTVYNQSLATEISLKDHIILICGRYKGVDERIKKFFPVTEISVGDYILSGGELAAMVIIDTVVRLLPGVISDIDSAWTDSFNDHLLDCNYYTRPENFKGVKVPEVLLSGDHRKIEKWRQKQREEITRNMRPELYEKYKETIKKE